LEKQQPLQMAKPNTIDTLNTADKAKYKHLLAEAKNNPSDVNLAWKLISLCETVHLHEVIYDHLEPIIRYGKK
jgi:hypothetical protein